MTDDTRQARIDDERHDAATNAIRADNPRLPPLQARHIARIALQAAAPAERGDLDTLTAEVGAWGERTFPNATDLSIVNHLQEEVTELLCSVVNVWDQVRDGNVNIAEEAADCLMLLMHLAHRNGFSLMAEARKKFEVNQMRTWNTVTAGGYVKHDEVKP